MFLEKKELKRIISEERGFGKNDQEIYNVLIEKHKDKDEIAIMLTDSLKKEDRNKIRFWNTILLVLIGLTIIFKVIATLNISVSSGKLWTLLFVLLTPILNIAFFLIVLNYRIQLYKFIAIFTMLSFVNTIGKMGEGLDLFLSIFFSVSIIGLSFALYYNNKPAELKKDGNGNHIFV
ncbi:hypothetical protein DNU06_17465 [Putridiphycobacter roseus]|uniref:Uncharacterized protein n=3 Tax=Putridiphycobacter roseus TaxID=2219161 RepID=A0A2W1NLH6_9FLAO|nr:hypothetical protein DNU06_17465 [Putridiphycobacter roseus]